MNDSADVRDLQNLWVKVTEVGIKRILEVLPERHPTHHKYLSSLNAHLTAVQENYPKENSDEVRTKTSSVWSFRQLLESSFFMPPTS